MLRVSQLGPICVMMAVNVLLSEVGGYLSRSTAALTAINSMATLQSC